MTTARAFGWSSMLDNDNPTAKKKSSVAEWTEEEAESLFREYVRLRDRKTRDRLVIMHQNLVRFLAGKFANRGEPLEDLVQVGVIGLINAIDRFDPERGTKFSTYATPTIVGEIRRHFRDKAWSLKVPRRLQELNLAANKASEELSQRLGHPPSIQEIAVKVGASEEETLEAIELGNAYDTVSLDSKLPYEGESAPLTLAEFVGDIDSSLQSIETYGDLKQAVDCLEPREKAIIYYRFFKDMSQTEVAKRLNISQMHVSRLQQKALKRLKELLSQ
ncbi:SigB/SigF/SigG family RNA polymerase sigma factor [bacterium]|nr:SigB/SigF/SigG family RNA polymerase sigma factor [bacterium]